MTTDPTARHSGSGTHPPGRVGTARIGVGRSGLLAAMLICTVPTATVLTGSVPAVATPAGCEDAPFAATATADLVKLTVLDLRRLGVQQTPLTDVQIAQARSSMSSTELIKAQSTARYASAELLGLHVPAGALDQVTAAQAAPPDHRSAQVVKPHAFDLGVLSAGTGMESAYARWQEGQGCGRATGTVSKASSSVLDATILPARSTLGVPAVASQNGLPDGSLAALPSNAAAQTSNEVLPMPNHGFGVGSTAGIGAAELVLFRGSKQEIRVRVLHPPTLRAVAGGSKERSSVRYDAPILEIVTPGGRTVRLDSPDEHYQLDLPASPDSLPSTSQPSTSLPSTSRLGGPASSGDAPVAAPDAAPDGATAASPVGPDAGAAQAGTAGTGSSPAHDPGPASTATGEVHRNGPPPGTTPSGTAAASSDAASSDAASSDAASSDAASTDAASSGAPAAESTPSDGTPSDDPTSTGAIARLLAGLAGQQTDPTPDSGTPGAAGAGATPDSREHLTAAKRPARAAGSRLAVRLSLGHLDSTITDRSVQAEATSLRLQVYAKGGYGQAATVADLGVGVLRAAASAPPQAVPPVQSNPGGQSPGGALPITGYNVTNVAGAGLLLLVLGRFLVLLGRRRLGTVGHYAESGWVAAHRRG